MKRFSIKMLKRGKLNGISGARLAETMQISKRAVSAEIEAARRAGYLICSDNHGYYLPGTKEELERTYKIMRRRALSILFTMKTTRQALKNWKDSEEAAENDMDTKH